MIRDIQIQIHHGPVADAPKTFELRFFFVFRKAPITLWLSSGMGKDEVISELLDFVKKVVSEEGHSL